jgi:predicted glycosyltransferase
MRIGVFANTPAQLHFYKNIIKELEKGGCSIKLLLRDYGETIEIASNLDIDYTVYSKLSFSKANKIFSLPRDVFTAYKKLRKFDPDIIVGNGVYDAFASILLRSSCIEFEDSEPMVNKVSYSIQFKLYLPFVDAIITPSSFRQDLGRKHLRVESYKELAYLHPNYYKPKNDVLDFMGVDSGEYALLRFNAFSAVHDFGIRGFSLSDKVRLVNELEKHAKVFISSELKLPEKLEKYRLPVPKSRIHDVIYHAKLLVTDTQTMTTEAGILGTPAIRCNKFVGKKDMGNFIELEKKYGLIYNYREPEMAIKKALELVKEDNLKEEWRKKRERLLKDKIDITAFMVWFIEKYPESLEEFKQNPEIQYRFR